MQGARWPGCWWRTRGCGRGLLVVAGTCIALAGCGGGSGTPTAASNESRGDSAPEAPLDQRVERARQSPKRMGRAAEIWNADCIACHGQAGGGGVGPNLTDRYWLHGGTMAEIRRSIARGFPMKGMLAYEERLSPAEIDALVAYVLEMQGTDPPGQLPPQGQPVD